MINVLNSQKSLSFYQTTTSQTCLKLDTSIVDGVSATAIASSAYVTSNTTTRFNNQLNAYLDALHAERERIASTIEKSNLPITYLGRLNQSQMVEQYLKSEVFISLDRSEPYGIVFLEALVAGCKIVCPVTGGQMEILKDYRDYVSYVDVNDIKDISIGIRKALNNEALPQLSEKERLDFSYMKTAKKLLGILERFQK